MIDNRTVAQAPVLKIHRAAADVQLPRYATAGAAAFDIYAYLPYDKVLADSTAKPSLVIETGLSFEIPEGWVLKLYSRSGQAFKENTRLGNCVGIIDSDYRGLLRVKLTRDDGDPLVVHHGERIAQCILERAERVEFHEVDELSYTERGIGAYGSTGR